MRCFALCTLVLASVFYPVTAFAQEKAFDWRQDWAATTGFTLSIDSTGYHLPTAIAFVPNPGPNPDDPLYFVTEVRGTLKVVTNDRTVHTFAEGFFQLTPEKELPASKGQVGLAGLCLEPQRGYVFVTFAYQDEAGILRNNMIRFETKLHTFALQPTGQTSFTEVFLPYESGLAHHIGPCQIKDDLLYVSVGEAWQARLTQDLTTMHGKLIRMTLDGKPVPSNPFYEDGDTQKAINYVWAYGLRNPFGLKMVGDRLFAADNGQHIDRFIEIRQGENYLWNGNDKTIAANAAFVFVPSIGPVQMDYYTGDPAYFPAEYAGNFFVGSSAFEKERNKITGLFVLKYDLTLNKITRTPEYFVKYRGDEYQAVTGVAFGPDGLYFTPLMPNAADETSLLKVTYQPEAAYPYTTMQITDGQALFVEKGCAGCHSIGESWGYGGTAGPNLAREELVERLTARLNTEDYRKLLDEMDRIEVEPQSLWKTARAEVRAATGMDRIKTWVKYHIQEPRFDTLYSVMPNLGLSDDEAAVLTAFLVNERGRPSSFSLRGFLPQPIKVHHLALAFGAGMVTVVGLFGVWHLFTRRTRSPHNLGRDAAEVPASAAD
jgi:glucose/arabinose dehydrogenase